MNKDKKFHDLLSYILRAYGKSGSLSMDRILHTLYLFDWSSTLNGRKQISSINWRKFNESFSSQLERFLSNTFVNETEVEIRTSFGGLTAEDKNIMNDILKKTIPLTEIDLLKLVMSTFPMASSKENVDLDLGVLAQDYQDNYSFIQ